MTDGERAMRLRFEHVGKVIELSEARPMMKRSLPMKVRFWRFGLKSILDIYDTQNASN